MTSTTQKTIRNAMSCSGIGLHSGQPVTMTIRPAAPNTGIIFRRTDLATDDRTITDIPARFDCVQDTTLCSLLGNTAGTRLGTVEHVMAALAGTEIANLLIEVDGPELPIMDGSSAPFVLLVECAGIIDQNVPRRVLRVLKDVYVEDEGRFIRLSPDDVFSVRCGIDFDTRVIANQTYAFFLFNDAFKREISRARTFGFAHQVDMLRSRGLIQGGSLDNAIVIDGDQILNKDGLRFQDECVRHKILDLIGDLYLSGGPIVGRLEAHASGHGLHNALLHALFADPEAYEWVEAPWGEVVPSVAQAQQNMPAYQDASLKIAAQ